MTGKNKKEKKKKDIAVSVKNVSKIFKVPHRKIDSLRGAFVNSLRKKTYEKFKALDDVSFEVERGEFLGIIGHNGAGKSTLLKILANIYKPDSGSVKINGRIAPFLELGIGFNPELSGRDNIYLNATVLGLTKKEIDKKFNDIVEFSELEQFIDQQIKNYSSGMKSRLAFSVSIHANREILLMDEVLAVGDTSFQEKCLDIFKSYKKMGRTVILVTHSMLTVREYCDRALLLDKGEILDVGNVDEVCDQYIFNTMSEDERKELEKKEQAEMKEKEGKEKIKKIKKEMSGKEKEKKPVKSWKELRYEKYGSKIEKIFFLDSEYKDITRIKRGHDFIVRTVLDIKKPNKKDIIAVQIIDKDTGCIVCGNNTFVDNFRHEWRAGKNIVDLTIRNNFFNRGDVYARIVLIRKRGAENETIDEYSGMKEGEFIKINPMDLRVGITYANHDWEHKYEE